MYAARQLKGSNMELNEFLNKIKSAMEEYFSQTANISIQSVTKNNGIILQGIVITIKGNNVAPTIYVDGFFREYKNGKTFGTIVNEIINIYEKNQLQDNVDMNFFLNYETVKQTIMFKLINFKKNETLLKNVPHIKYLDLAIVFYSLLLNDTFGSATILIHNSHLKLWNITEDELYQSAMENTPKVLKPKIHNMEEIMREMLLDNLKREFMESGEKLGEKADEDMFESAVDKMLESICTDKEIPMYVLSNQTKLNGASCILYQNTIREFASKREDDFYILPSSIHEVILVPAKECREPQRLPAMVREVNETQVMDEEILSDEVYYYSYGKNNIVCYLA